MRVSGVEYWVFKGALNGFLLIEVQDTGYMCIFVILINQSKLNCTRKSIYADKNMDYMKLL